MLFQYQGRVMEFVVAHLPTELDLAFLLSELISRKILAWPNVLLTTIPD